MIKSEVKNSEGFEQRITVKFYAPVLKDLPGKEIEYDCDRMGDKERLRPEEVGIRGYE